MEKRATKQDTADAFCEPATHVILLIAPFNNWIHTSVRPNDKTKPLWLVFNQKTPDWKEHHYKVTNLINGRITVHLVKCHILSSHMQYLRLITWWHFQLYKCLMIFISNAGLIIIQFISQKNITQGVIEVLNSNIHLCWEVWSKLKAELSLQLWKLNNYLKNTFHENEESSYTSVLLL